MVSELPTSETGPREQGAFDGLIGAELSSAHIEKTLAQNHVMETLWRAEAAIAEAAASVALEDQRLSEHDLLLCASGGAVGLKSRAVKRVDNVLRFLRAPGDALRDPLAVLTRIEGLAREDGLSSGKLEGAMNLTLDDAQMVFSFCRGRSPILEAMLATAHYASLTERANPVAERMVFVAAEQASRVTIREKLAGAGAGARPAVRQIDADWIVLPASALSSARLRSWSPEGGEGARDLMDAITAFQSREADRLAATRTWVRQMEEEGLDGCGGSHIADAARVIATEPVFTTASLADRLSITQRGASSIIDQLEDSGLLVDVNWQRGPRIWATPMLADRLDGLNVANSNDRWLAERMAARRHSARSEATTSRDITLMLY